MKDRNIEFTKTHRISCILAVVLISSAAALILPGLVTAKPRLTSGQQKAFNNCTDKFLDTDANCLNNGGTPDQCAKGAYRRYQQCMNSAGLSTVDFPPPKPPKIGPHPSPGPNKSPTPAGKANPVASAGPIKGNGNPSPTTIPRKSSTSSKHKQ